MTKDFKIGLISGLVLAVVTLGYLATRPSLSPQARMLRSSEAAATDASPTEEPVSPEDRQPLPQPGNVAREAPTETSSGQSADPETGLFGQLTQEQDTTPVEQRSDLPDLTVYELDEKIKTTRFHIVRKNETLSAISQQYYGSPNKWRKILEANEDTIPDANKIAPGVKLIIPD